MTYVEEQSDHEFTAFLAGLNPVVVARDLVAHHTPVERRRARYLKQQETEMASRRAYELSMLAARIQARSQTKESNS